MFSTPSLASSLLFILGIALVENGWSLSVERSTAEQEELDRRIERFYKSSPHDPDAMNAVAPKYHLGRLRFESPNPELRFPQTSETDFLLRQAQRKATDAYERSRDSFLSRTLPMADRQSIERNDRPEALVASWVSAFDRNLTRLPTSGKVSYTYWSGDYWRMRWGLTSYRYASGEQFERYREAVRAYQQPQEWQRLWKDLEIAELAQKIIAWSPSEKYDLTVGDTSFALTLQQKHEGREHVDREGNIEEWFGLCHGWAAASVFVPPAKQPVSALGAQGVKVTWYPEDIQAMATLAWSNGRFNVNSIGGRCRAKEATRHSNGRLKQQECFDTNPATFHLVTTNLIGKAGVPFIIDATFDYEVWNQPVISYSIEYFNPLQPEQRNADWTKVAVPYDAAFKAKDRFQSPLTRGKRISRMRFDDSGIKQIVGVIATIVYVETIDAVHGEKPSEVSTYRVSYTYDLELQEKEVELIPQGGEWHENTHPDFLWVPRRGAVAFHPYDVHTPAVDLSQRPSTPLTRLAKTVSRQGYPLCEVLKALVNHAGSGAKYECAKSDEDEPLL